MAVRTQEMDARDEDLCYREMEIRNKESQQNQRDHDQNHRDHQQSQREEFLVPQKRSVDTEEVRALTLESRKKISPAKSSHSSGAIADSSSSVSPIRVTQAVRYLDKPENIIIKESARTLSGRDEKEPPAEINLELFSEDLDLDRAECDDFSPTPPKSAGGGKRKALTSARKSGGKQRRRYEASTSDETDSFEATPRIKKPRMSEHGSAAKICAKQASFSMAALALAFDCSARRLNAFWKIGGVYYATQMVAKLFVHDSGILEYAKEGDNVPITIKVRNITEMLPLQVGNDTTYYAMDIKGRRSGTLFLSCFVEGVLMQIHNAIVMQKQRHPGGPFAQIMADLLINPPQNIAYQRSLFPSVFGHETTPQDSSDVTLICTDDPLVGTFHCHRAILAQHSTTFDRMLNGEFEEATESTVLVEDVNGPTMQEILQFIYCGYISTIGITNNISADVQHDLLYAATKYNLDTLVEYLVIGFEENLNAQTACRYVVWADRFGLEAFTRSCLRVMVKKESRDVVLVSPEWPAVLRNEKLMTDIYCLAARQ